MTTDFDPIDSPDPDDPDMTWEIAQEELIKMTQRMQEIPGAYGEIAKLRQRQYKFYEYLRNHQPKATGNYAEQAAKALIEAETVVNLADGRKLAKIHLKRAELYTRLAEIARH